MEGRSEVGDGRWELVRLAARLVIEEALEGEARDALGRDYYARGATPGAGYRNGYRPGGRHRVQRPTDRRSQRAVSLAENRCSPPELTIRSIEPDNRCTFVSLPRPRRKGGRRPRGAATLGAIERHL